MKKNMGKYYLKLQLFKKSHLLYKKIKRKYN